MLIVLTIALSVFDGSFAQAPGDADTFCTEFLPGFGVNILDYAPEVKPLMDSRHYQNLLPPHTDAVWQEVDNDNNNPSGTTTDVSWRFCSLGLKYMKATVSIIWISVGTQVYTVWVSGCSNQVKKWLLFPFPVATIY